MPPTYGESVPLSHGFTPGVPVLVTIRKRDDGWFTGRGSILDFFPSDQPAEVVQAVKVVRAGNLDPIVEAFLTATSPTALHVLSSRLVHEPSVFTTAAVARMEGILRDGAGAGCSQVINCSQRSEFMARRIAVMALRNVAGANSEAGAAARSALIGYLLEGNDTGLAEGEPVLLRWEAARAIGAACRMRGIPKAREEVEPFVEQLRAKAVREAERFRDCRKAGWGRRGDGTPADAGN